ncbi:MAG: hypothetical protein HQ559_16245 [Lentisphaerae bacterium]|nr:hypothetical protein [Lentisphaerota bacterium]
MSATQTKSPDQARSKIMRLPFARRMEFNRMVRDGYKGRVLSKWLADHGVPDVNAENIRKYRISKRYKTWLAEEADIDRDSEKVEQSMRLAESLGGSASEKLKSILAGKLYPLLASLSDPEELNKLVKAVQTVTLAERLELQRHQEERRDEALQMERDRFERETCQMFLRWRKDERAAEIADSAATNADKIAALRQAFFADVDALEKSGTVELPK